jgi:hypothetical protein
MVDIAQKKLDDLTKMLNDSISNLLYGGSADPGWSECQGAATCYRILKTLGLEINNEEEVKDQLSNPEMNISEHNFLE